MMPPSATLSNLAVSRTGSLAPSSRETYFPTHSSGISPPDTWSSCARRFRYRISHPRAAQAREDDRRRRPTLAPVGTAVQPASARRRAPVERHRERHEDHQYPRAPGEGLPAGRAHGLVEEKPPYRVDNLRGRLVVDEGLEPAGHAAGRHERAAGKVVDSRSCSFHKHTCGDREPNR